MWNDQEQRICGISGFLTNALSSHIFNSNEKGKDSAHQQSRWMTCISPPLSNLHPRCPVHEWSHHSSQIKTLNVSPLPEYFIPLYEATPDDFPRRGQGTSEGHSSFSTPQQRLQKKKKNILTNRSPSPVEQTTVWSGLPGCKKKCATTLKWDPPLSWANRQGEAQTELSWKLTTLPFFTKKPP